MKKNKAVFLFTISILFICVSDLSAQSIAYKLAVLKKDGYVSENDQIVKRFDNLLQQLVNKYDVNKQQIGDMTYKLKEVAKNRGIEVSMIKVMEGAIQVGNLTYAEYLGSYLTFRYYSWYTFRYH